MAEYFLTDSFFDSNNPYYTWMFAGRYRVLSNIQFGRASLEYSLCNCDLVLIISIVIAAISTTLVGRYSCKSDWQGCKKLTSSLTNVWAVILEVSLSTMSRALSLPSLFIAWMCFSLAFSRVFQAFLTFLIDSGYKSPIQNVDDLFALGIKRAHQTEYSFIFENFDETEPSKLQRICMNWPSYEVCDNWAKSQKNRSKFLLDKMLKKILLLVILLARTLNSFAG